MADFKAPFLKKITLDAEKVDKNTFPFNRFGYLNTDFTFEFTSSITYFIGENGSGKSTMLEAIAKLCGFHESGGGAAHQLYESSDHHPSALGAAMRGAWLPKVNRGFFLRAESFFNLANHIYESHDRLAPKSAYGGKHLHAQSHGESFMSWFATNTEFKGRKMFLMDEPEAALSPNRQLSLLSYIHQWVESGEVQIIIATHSPIILAYPNAPIWEFSDQGLKTMSYEQAPPYTITKGFVDNPKRSLKELMA